MVNDQIAEMTLFHLLARKGSLSAAARELGLSVPAVSKRLAKLEQRLGVRLVNRTTRRLTLTDEGEAYLESAARILGEIERLEQNFSVRRAVPKGLLRVNASFGFGRRHLAPAVSDFVKRYPEVEVQLQLTDRPLNLGGEGYDLGIRIGDLPDTALVARRIAPNRRLVCAAPAYLRKHGVPRTPAELARHNCLILRENDAPYGTWRFAGPRGTETVKVRGTLSANDGEVVHQWALAGHGIILRSGWDVAASVQAGKLQVVLTDYTLAAADIYAVSPQRQHLSAKVRAFVDFLAERFGAAPPWGS